MNCKVHCLRDSSGTFSCETSCCDAKNIKEDYPQEHISHKLKFLYAIPILLIFLIIVIYSIKQLATH